MASRGGTRSSEEASDMEASDSASEVKGNFWGLRGKSRAPGAGCWPVKPCKVIVFSMTPARACGLARRGNERLSGHQGMGLAPGSPAQVHSQVDAFSPV